MKRWQAFRQVNFQDDVALHSSRHASLDNESQLDDDDDDDNDDDEEEVDFDDARSSTVASSADRSDATCIDGTTTPVWHRMLHALSKVWNCNLFIIFWCLNTVVFKLLTVVQVSKILATSTRICS